ncbi:MAG: hypothetical protein K9J13_02155 [Saprospiraceae bacterium]|nr:hypothetical protein [Saprospiraceae bacterium]
MLKTILKILVLIFLIFNISCKKDSSLPPVDMGYDYFPTTIGQWIIYDVDSIDFNEFQGTVDTFIFQIKEVIESSFIDNEGRQAERIERYYRLNDTIPWVLSDVYTSTRTNMRAERFEENISYIKMAFPIKLGSVWDCNATNTLDAEECSYEDIHTPYSESGITFDSTVAIVQDEFITLISEDFSKEIYAKHIGLIHKENVHITLNPLTGEITSGVNYKYSINSYGK